eukprot:scaffold10250_cov21-Tisochrysis_lutea.AAC.2
MFCTCPQLSWLWLLYLDQPTSLNQRMLAGPTRLQLTSPVARAPQQSTKLYLCIQAAADLAFTLLTPTSRMHTSNGSHPLILSRLNTDLRAKRAREAAMLPIVVVATCLSSSGSEQRAYQRASRTGNEP